ncbi:type II secretion system secretin GspD [Candidimonas nitroreducens]|uniref:Type II secretion system protein GspD n=1 Tax=Candidimonas nitroreducens TaxID=683354 RepID=A0A225LVV7_9BURK|nr:type II secretion system secretin GspD [Candidimonas nitroreducens]OWT53484.1 type II secretion system protein GspD [Candidimonas nitroreducens]
MISRHQRPQADSRPPLRLRPLASSVLVALALSGCATTQPGKPPQADGSPLMVYTSVGSQQAEQAQHFPDDTQARQPRPRRLQPLPARPTFDDEQPKQGAAAHEERTTRLNFKEADLQAVVRALAQFTGRNFVVDQRVRGKLTLVSDTPVDPDTAYSMLLGALRMQGFAVVEVDGVSRVVPEADAKLLGGPVASGGKQASGGELVTRVFPLHYEKAADLLPVLRPLIPPNNTITAQAGNNALVITDYASNLERIARIIRRVDTPMALNTDVIPIEYGVALDVAALAQRLLQDDQGRNDQQFRILADSRSNSVLVRASTPERLKLVRDLILRIDAPGSEAGNLHVVYLRNAQASHLAEVLRGALTGRSNTTNNAASTPLAATGMQQQQQHGTTVPTAAFSSPASAQTSLASSAQTGAGMSQTPLAEPQQAVSFSASGATVQADPTTNTLIISAPDPLYRSLRQVIDELDQRRAQVLIESLIVEVNADNAAELGVQWMAGSNGLDSGHSSFFGGANLGGTGIGTNTNALTTIDALGTGLSLGVVNGTVNVLGSQILNLSVLARALKQRGGVNVLSTPNLMTLDNEEASIIVGRTVPFVTGSYTTSGDGASNPFQTVQREDVGLTLRIRPQITEGGTVKLALYQEVSSIDPSSSLTSGSIITRKRALQTNVLVDNGQIIVLGGLLEDEMDDSDASVPVLGDIPVLGNLFKYRKRTHTKTNLMLFLRPHIVRTARDSAGVTLDRYNYMRALQTRQPSSGSWLMPAAAPTLLPNAQQDPRTGLIDLRGAAHGAGADAPDTRPAPQTPAPAATPQPAPVPARPPGSLL